MTPYPRLCVKAAGNCNNSNCILDHVISVSRYSHRKPLTRRTIKHGILVSKETVVLRREGDQNKNLVLSNELIKVELPP